MYIFVIYALFNEYENVLFQIIGCAVLGGGIWLRVTYGGYASLLHQYAALSADSLCLAAGIITFVVAFCGCCGSWFQIRLMLITVSLKTLIYL